MGEIQLISKVIITQLHRVLLNIRCYPCCPRISTLKKLFYKNDWNVTLETEHGPMRNCYLKAVFHTSVLFVSRLLFPKWSQLLDFVQFFKIRLLFRNKLSNRSWIIFSPLNWSILHSFSDFLLSFGEWQPFTSLLLMWSSCQYRKLLIYSITITCTN